jgi:hypothetical protein
MKSTKITLLSLVWFRCPTINPIISISPAHVARSPGIQWTKREKVENSVHRTRSEREVHLKVRLRDKDHDDGLTSRFDGQG